MEAEVGEIEFVREVNGGKNFPAYDYTGCPPLAACEMDNAP